MFPADAGRRLSEGLKAELDLKAAFWLYFEDADDWRLVLAAKSVDQEGPRSVYSRVRKYLEQHPEMKDIHLADITVFSPEDAIVRPLREAFDQTDLGDGKLIRKAVVTGLDTSAYLDEAYVYFAHM